MSEGRIGYYERMVVQGVVIKVERRTTPFCVSEFIGGESDERDVK